MSAAKPRIAIVDYQMGNLRSVEKALEHVGAHPEITSDPERIRAADKVILPGVGAFCDAIRELRSRQLVEPLRDCIASGKPFLGICLGLQLLFEKSFENGEYEGLGVLKGNVVRFNLPHEFKVPHIGWNRVHSQQANVPLLNGLSTDPYMYFVHSYYVVPSDPSIIWLTSDYSIPFCAAIRKDNLFATQFHPEKSQKEGLQLLKNFAEL
ncbi:MAG: imidazole glycerol phosphate synthase subunit HisH [Candidatus Moraniibacteriota bacterium]|nr:imidazole glycerol phosphate synthase subunit HisH [Planctomycetaceae bacterium]MBN8600008.1 imidazole glycerol phosphate synthase subunit HisH [Planctomycetota bacterium]TXH04283.1 MAG: imidazole glycerol phosphate synthase subunit HisH [Candidatus Moranbacteria bacterium]